MKRYFHAKLIYFLFLFCFSFSQNYYSIPSIKKPITFYPRFNIDGVGTFKLHYLQENSDDGVDLGYTIGADIIFLKTKWINFGGGYEIQFERELSDSPIDPIETNRGWALGGFGFNSFYGIIQVNSSSGLIYFARYGNTNFHGDSDFTSDGFFDLAGSAYASVGTLTRFSDNIFVEISRSYMQGDINYYGVNDLMWCEYETYNIGIGYYFE